MLLVDGVYSIVAYTSVQYSTVVFQIKGHFRLVLKIH